jgi:hypothetical protein
MNESTKQILSALIFIFLSICVIVLPVQCFNHRALDKGYEQGDCGERSFDKCWVKNKRKDLL